MKSPELPLRQGEKILEEIPSSPKTIVYYSLRAAPLFGVWYVGLLAFLIFSFKLSQGEPILFLAVALGLSGAVYLIGTILHWMWRVDLSQRDAWLSNYGIWMQTPQQKNQFIPYEAVVKIIEKKDWVGKWLHVEGIEIQYREGTRTKKIFLVGVENGDKVMHALNEKITQAGHNATALA